MTDFGTRIRELREANGDTRADLAEKLNMSVSGVGKIERGERGFKKELLKEISDIYGVPVSYFYGEEADLPAELKEIGIEWIRFAKEMKERELTPEQIKATLDLIARLNS